MSTCFTATAAHKDKLCQMPTTPLIAKPTPRSSRPKHVLTRGECVQAFRLDTATNQRCTTANCNQVQAPRL